MTFPPEDTVIIVWFAGQGIQTMDIVIQSYTQTFLNAAHTCSLWWKFFWKLVKGELRKKLVSYAEGFNVDLMHQGHQKVKQYTVPSPTWAIVTPKSEDVSQYICIYLPLLASPIPTPHSGKALISVTIYVTCRCAHPIGQLSLKYAFLNHVVS